MTTPEKMPDYTCTDVFRTNCNFIKTNSLYLVTWINKSRPLELNTENEDKLWKNWDLHRMTLVNICFFYSPTFRALKFGENTYSQAKMPFRDTVKRSKSICKHFVKVRLKYSQCTKEVFYTFNSYQQCKFKIHSSKTELRFSPQAR